MGQQQFSYTGSSQSWDVPQLVSELFVECYGAGGGHGAASGDPGGAVTGTLAVSDSDTLYVYVGKRGDDSGGYGGWPNGGNGASASATADNGTTASAASGAGGGSSDVRLNGTATGDIIALAGGGGGGGDAEGNSGGFTGAGGAGGATAEDGEDTSSVSGGEGGGASGFDGEDGIATSATDSNDEAMAGAGGGGGGGLNGGEHGGASANTFTEEGHGAGGGGGDGTASGLSNASQSVGGGSASNGNVYVSYLKRPTNLSASVNTNGNIALDWNDNSSDESGFEVYHSSSSGIDTSDTLVASLGADTTSYTDTTDRTGENYYRVRAYKNNVAEWSNETKVVTTTINYYDGGNWPEGVVYYHDGSSWVPASDVYTNDGTSWVKST